MSVGAGARGGVWCRLRRRVWCSSTPARRLDDEGPLAPRRKLSVRWARDEVPTGPVISASSAGADGATAVCARAFASPGFARPQELLRDSARGHPEASARRGAAYKALLRK